MYPGFGTLFCIILTVEPLIKDPPRKGHCMLNLSIVGHCLGNYHFLWFLFIENLREEDNLSIRDKTAEFGSTVHAIIDTGVTWSQTW